MVAIRVAAGEVNAFHAPSLGRAAMLLLRLGAGAVFIIAGYLKLWTPEIFADDIEAFRILPTFLVNLVALGLPPFEILLGLLLLTGWRRRPATFCAALTSGVFLIALVTAWIRGLSVNCGCFGSGDAGSPMWIAVARDLALFAVTGSLYADACRDRKPPTALFTTLSAGTTEVR